MSDFDPKYLRAPFLFGKPLRGIGRPGKPPMPWYYFKGQPASESQIQAGWDVARNEVLLDRPDFAEHLETHSTDHPKG